jgi:nucleotide-binding universal stress UspA family protein
VKMIAGEPLLKAALDATPLLGASLYLAIPIVLGLAFFRNHRRLASRIDARLASPGRTPPIRSSDPVSPAADVASMSTRAVPAPNPPGELRVLDILVPVDASANALRAVRHVIAEYRRHHELRVHLLNVQPRLSRHAARFVSRADRQGWLHDRAETAMAAAVALLTDAGVPHEKHWATGERAEQICAAARRLDVHHIVMGTARKNSITRMLEDSMTHRLLETTPVPVEVIAGDAVSKWERWGLPAGVVGLGGLLVLALD